MSSNPKSGGGDGKGEGVKRKGVRDKCVRNVSMTGVHTVQAPLVS